MMRSLSASLVLVACAGAAHSQCTSQWDTTIGNPGLGSGYVAPITAWDPGSGQRLYVGGSFSGAGGSSANAYLAAYNPTNNTWSPLGSGISAGFTNAFMTSMVPFNPGTGERLVAGGFFDAAGGVPQTASLAMWNGTTWEAMGTTWTGSTRGSIWSMAVWNNRLYVGGGVVNQPGTIAGLPWAGFASWDGTAWRSHATSMAGFSPYVGALQVFDDGSGPAIYAAGRFDSIDGVPGTALIARWTGEAWSAVGGGVTPGSASFGIEAMLVHNDGSGPALYVAGYPFTPAGQASTNVAKWDGHDWSPVGPLIGFSRITSMAVFNDGTGDAIYVGGTGNAIGALGFLAKLQGGQWVSVDGGMNTWVFGLSTIGDRLYAGGSFVTVNGATSNRIVSRTSCAQTCYANCDGSTTAPILNVQDFTCFLQRYAAGESYANCDGSTQAPVLNVQDFTCFLQRYAAGCP